MSNLNREIFNTVDKILANLPEQEFSVNPWTYTKDKKKFTWTSLFIKEKSK